MTPAVHNVSRISKYSLVVREGRSTGSQKTKTKGAGVLAKGWKGGRTGKSTPFVKTGKGLDYAEDLRNRQNEKKVTGNTTTRRE